MGTTLEKIAQRRNILDWISEQSNVSRRVSEHLSKHYEEQVEKLRDVDDNIREQIAIDIKSDLKEARRAGKGGYFQHFDKKVREIIETINGIVAAVEPLEQARRETVQDIYNAQYPGASYATLEEAVDGLIKNAGFFDDIKNKVQRNIGLNYLEKIYPSVAERNKAVRSVIRDVRDLVKYVLTTLKEMSKLRNKGNVGGYIAAAQGLKNNVDQFANRYEDVFENHIKPVLVQPSDEETNVEEIEQKTEQKAEPEPEPEPQPELGGEIEVEGPEVKLPSGTTAPAEPTTTPSPLDYPALPLHPEEPAVVEESDPPASQEQVPQAMDLEPLPDWMMQSPEKIPYLEINRDQGNKTQRKFLGEFANATSDLIKQAISEGKSNQFIGELFLKLSNEFENKGYPDESLKLLVIAEGYLDA